jgi:hypothetical protein
VKSLKWKQVNAWRLRQHCLAPRLKRRGLVKAVTRACGIQAQVMSAAELAIGARVDGLSPQAVQSALWQEHSLVKTWAMRSTLHLIAADDLPLYVAARGVHVSGNWDAYFAYYGIKPAQQGAFLAAVPEVLGDKPMTREQLATAVAKHTRAPKLRDLILLSNWGSPLKPSAFRGDLCFGPSQGQNVTFVNPRKWIGEWQSFEPEQALQEIARRYLRAYGPARVEDFMQWWWGWSALIPTRKLFKSLEDELEEVDVDGWRAFALRKTLKSMEQTEPSGTIRLLPLFDAYVLGLGRDIEPLLPKTYKPRVFRPQGWISAVVLVDGTMKGVWEYKTRGAQTLVRVRMFSRPDKAVRSGIEAETERLADFLNKNVSVEYVGL